MNKNMFVSKMKLYGDRQEDLAKAIAISPQRFSAKLNEVNGAQFTQSEIKAIIGRYNLTDEEVGLIFFCN